jgi:hypothetical protein
MRRALAPLAVLLSFVSFAASSRAQAVFVMSGGDGTNLVSVNVSTGAATTVGSLTQTEVYGMAFHPNGTLYGLVGGYGYARLATINPATGVATVFGAPAPVFDMMGMDFDAQGNLFTVSWADYNLYRMDTTTGAATLVGPLVGPVDIMDLAFAPNGELWGVGNAGLWKINPITGQATFATAVDGLVQMMSIAFDASGTLFGATYEAPSRFYQVNPVTGQTSLVGTFSDTSYVHGGDIFFTAVPEPSSCAAVAGAAVALFILARHRRHHPAR